MPPGIDHIPIPVIILHRLRHGEGREAVITVRAVLFTILFYGWSLGLLTLCMPFFLLPHRYTFFVARVWGGGAALILRLVNGLSHELRGLENIPEGPVIYAIKHQSSWETIVFNTIIRHPHWVIKRELFFVPIFGWYMWHAGVIGLDRSAGASAMRQLLRQAKVIADRGDPILIFPEGSRTEPGVSGEYQPGVAALYSILKLPVVPVALNSGVYWARREFAKHPGKIVVEFLPPIEPGLDRKVFMATLQDKIEERAGALYLEAKKERELQST